MRTETLAIVFTDIKGYTAATSAQTHQENARMLRRVERIIAPVVRGYSGRVVKSIGDAYMIVFRSPTEAVHCAMAIQDHLHRHNTSASANEGIHIRIAINIGEVRVHRGDVFGEPVNIAARIESVTPADEIYFSQSVYLTMNRSQIATERVGDYELKGIPEPVTVYRCRKFAHAEGQTAEGEAPVKASGLPFGGAQLSHWRRMRWVRVATVAVWMLTAFGVAGAAYVRYRPGTDYTDVTARVEDALDRNEPITALALAGEIPRTALLARMEVRKFRRQAIAALLQVGEMETARTEIDALLQEDDRDAEALLLKAALLTKKQEQARQALQALTQALALDAGLVSRPEVANILIFTYLDDNTRQGADQLVAKTIKDAAIPALKRALTENQGDRVARNTIAARLTKLGAGDAVDWVPLAIEDLKSPSCKTRKAAVQRLAEADDATAIGPLLKLADAKTCGSSQAKQAADALMK